MDERIWLSDCIKGIFRRVSEVTCHNGMPREFRRKHRVGPTDQGRRNRAALEIRQNVPSDETGRAGYCDLQEITSSRGTAVTNVPPQDLT